MKKAIRVLIIAISLFMTMQIPAYANLQNNLVPQQEDKKTEGQVELNYNAHPNHHYKLDTYIDTDGDWMPWNWGEGASNQLFIALSEIINASWMINVTVSSFTMMIVQEAFQLDFVSDVIDQVAAAVQNIAGFGPGGFMATGIWPILIIFIISIVGAWATYVGMIKRELNRAWGGLISSIVIFVFSLGFFSNADEVLSGVNKWSSDLQSDILAVSASIVNPGASYTKEEGIATIRNQMFDLMIYKPYQLLQYGTTDVEEERVNKLLDIDPYKNGEEREEMVKSEVENDDNTMMSLEGISQRAAFVPLLGIANLIISIFLLLISGSIILYQLVFLVLALFAPVPLLMALVPRWQQTAVDWAMKLLHAQLMKIAIAFLLTILFGVSAILYRATEESDLGYLAMLLIQIICFLGVWAKRNELFSMVSTAANNVSSSTGQTLANYKQKYRDGANAVKRGVNHAQKLQNSYDKKQKQKELADRRENNKNAKNQNGASDVKKGTALAAASGAGGQQYLNRRQNSDEENAALEQDKLARQNGVKQLNGNENERLMDRRPVDLEENAAEDKSADGKVTHIDDLRRRRLETGGMGNAPLADRQPLKDAQRDSGASMERPGTQDIDHVERQQSERNVNLINQQSHQDKINDSQNSHLSERRSLESNTDREVSQDGVNRERLMNNINNRSVSEEVTQSSNEANKNNINNVVQRNVTTNERKETTINDTVDRNSSVTQNNNKTENEAVTRNSSVTQNNIKTENETVTRNNNTVQNNSKTENSTVSRNNNVIENSNNTENNTVERKKNTVSNNRSVTKTNHQKDTTNQNTVNRKDKEVKSTASEIVNRIKKSGKNLTKWEAEQQAKEKRKDKK